MNTDNKDRIAKLTAAQRAIFEERVKGKTILPHAAHTISCRADPTTYPPTVEQKELWFVDLMEVNAFYLHLSASFLFSGRLNFDALKQAINAIIKRHENLRASFREIEGSPIAVISPSLTLEVEKVSVSDFPEDERQAEAHRIFSDRLSRPFNLTFDPLIRATLISLSQQDHALQIIIHHLVTDKLSTDMFWQELLKFYDLYANNKPLSLPELPIQYGDYAVWQQEWYKGPEMQEHLVYWREKLADPPILRLHTDHPRPLTQSHSGAREYGPIIANHLLAGVKALSSSQNTSRFVTLLAVYSVLLHRYSGQDDVIIGTPVNNRDLEEIQALIGYFLNMLGLRINLSGNPSFLELLSRVRVTCLEAFAHQRLSSVKVLQELRLKRTPGYSPLYQTTIVYTNESPEPAVQSLDLAIKPFFVSYESSFKDLSFIAFDYDEIVTLAIEYNTSLFEVSTIMRAFLHYQALLEEIVSDPRRRLSDLSLLSEREREQILIEWNQTEARFPEQCVHELFESQSELTPDATALICGEQLVSYGELNRRANLLAHQLRAMGVGADICVGLCLERSVEMVVGMLAILKAGGAYLPLGPDSPLARLSFMLEDADVGVVVSNEDCEEKLPSHWSQVVCLDREWEAIEKQSDKNLRGMVGAENRAYVLYTSGSTGSPKGVMIPHRALSNHMFWMQKTFALGESDRVIQKTPFSFDASVWEFYAPLLVGAQLVLAKPGAHRESAYLMREMAERQVSVAQMTPRLLQALVEEEGWEKCRKLRWMFCGGEALSGGLAEKFHNVSGASLINLYGPTETTVDASYWEYDGTNGQESVPIGRPIANLQLYVVNGEMGVAPVGVVGELFIGGAGVGRGYLKAPQLTAERFVPDLYGMQVGGRLYRTGDLVRYRENGSLEFIERRDHQVKIRGHRIELGEIETVLREHPCIGEAVVLAREDQGEKRLAAYLVIREGSAPDHNELRRYLKERLPDYMAPSSFILLDKLPLTSNGKLDRIGLPAPESISPDLEKSYVAPRTPIEETLAGILADVLGLKRVGIQDNFFDLGGHSLLATQIISRIKGSLGIELPLRVIFEQPIARGMAQSVEEARREAAGLSVPPLIITSREKSLPMSFAQQRLWFLDRLEPDSPLYNMPLALRLNGELNSAALRLALTEIVRRHEVLRTTFAFQDDEQAQVIHPTKDVELPLIDLSGLGEREGKTQAELLVREEANQPFDLKHGPLWRASLLRLRDSEHVMSLTMHHIISDGWSMGVLVREVAELYAAYLRGEDSPLPELPVQYADYAVWQREWLQGETLARQMDYWRKRLEGAPGAIDLPTDKPRPVAQSYRGAHYPVSLPGGLAEALAELSRREGVTLFMTLLAAYDILLARYSGQEDLVVGADIANRNRAETEGLIGFFVNQLALRADLSGEPSFRQLLGRTREVCLGAYRHQDVPFEKLVEELQPERDLSRSPIFQVKLVLQNAPVGALELPGLKLGLIGEAGEVGTAKFELTLALEESAAGVSGMLEYNTDLHEESSIERMVNHYRKLLEAIVNCPERRWRELPMLGESEREQILMEWNRTERDYPREECVHRLFERRVEQNAEAIAVVCAEQAVSYDELNRRANQLAHHLQAMGVGPESCVGLCLERSVEMVVGMMGILKAGGAYLPLDPESPLERLALMVEEAGAGVVVSSEECEGRLPSGLSQVVCVEREWVEIGKRSVENPQSEVGAENQVYVIYTSGSTGRPKGVMIQHGSLCNHMLWMQESFALSEADNVFQKTPFSFDASVWEFYAPLLIGAKLVIARPGGHRDTSYLMREMAEREVSVVQVVPKLLEALVEEEGWEERRNLRRMCCGGEALSWRLVEKFRGKNQASVINLYGPSETTIEASYWECGENIRQEPIPIGRPIWNARVYVVDGEMEPAPIGVRGEICIGGVGLARGYVKGEAWTAERFVPDPHGPECGGRLYRTGDIGRYKVDGSLEYVGRLDGQIKLRGYRIELGEIEATLVSHRGVRQAAVTVREDQPGERRLACYFTASEEEVRAEELQEHLRHRLPEYMIPVVWMRLEELPLTPNGKVDRRALAILSLPEVKFDFADVAPRTATEREIAEIWKEILQLEQIGIHDNFFELGGHSLLATQLIARIRMAFGVSLTIRDFFNSPTIKDVAEAIDEDVLTALGSETLDEILAKLEAADESSLQRELGLDI